MRLAVILVHYHTAELAAQAVASLRADLAGTGLDVEWRLVDNGSDAAGRERLASLPVERIDPGRNLGFAGGVRLGVARSSAEWIVVMNPDVWVLPGCVPALLDCLRGGAAVAGPRFYWDRGRRLLLPPGERRRRREELLALLARKGERWAARARRRWRRHARAHWQARAPLASPALTGSLLALPRSTWEEVGPFDAEYPLYFEETDWLLRVARRGLVARYVPAAEAVHHYGRSAVQEPRAAEWFETSARRFRRRHYGAWFAGLLAALDRRLPRGTVPPAPPPMPAAGLELRGVAGPLPFWIEVSPNPTGFPAAAELLVEAPERWTLPPEVAAALPPGEWAVRVVDGQGREVACYALPPAAGRR
jgi:GT2 family glycosyltransferase